MLEIRFPNDKIIHPYAIDEIIADGRKIEVTCKGAYCAKFDFDSTLSQQEVDSILSRAKADERDRVVNWGRLVSGTEDSISDLDAQEREDFIEEIAKKAAKLAIKDILRSMR